MKKCPCGCAYPDHFGQEEKSSARPITPKGLASEMIAAADNDPGTEVKCMLFYVDGKEVHFVRVRSQSRIMVMELAREYDKKPLLVGRDTPHEATAPKEAKS